MVFENSLLSAKSLIHTEYFPGTGSYSSQPLDCLFSLNCPWKGCCEYTPIDEDRNRDTKTSCCLSQVQALLIAEYLLVLLLLIP